MNKRCLLFTVLSGVVFSYNAQACTVSPENDLISVVSCGAIPNDGKSDSEAFKKAITKYYSTSSEQSSNGIYIPDGKYYIDESIYFITQERQLGKWGRGLIIQGQSKEGVLIHTDKDIYVFDFADNADYIDLSGVTLKSTADEKVGTAIWLQTYRSKIEDVAISGFGVAISSKISVWNYFNNIYIDNVNTGIVMHDKSKSGTPDPGNWNLYSQGKVGFHNNAHVIENVTITNATDYGLNLFSMSSNINNVNISLNESYNRDFGVGIKIGNSRAVMFNNSITNSSISGYETGILLDSLQQQTINNTNVANNSLSLQVKNVDMVDVSNSNIDKVKAESSLVKIDSIYSKSGSEVKRSIIDSSPLDTQMFYFHVVKDDPSEIALGKINSFDEDKCISVTGRYDSYSVLQQYLLGKDLQFKGAYPADSQIHKINLAVDANTRMLTLTPTYGGYQANISKGKVSISDKAHCVTLNTSALVP